jgi:hypothetical protein
MSLRDEIENRFTHHRPFGSQVERYIEIRQMGKEFALRLEELCPYSAELKRAINHIDDAVKEANAAIARHERPDEEA